MSDFHLRQIREHLTKNYFPFINMEDLKKIENTDDYTSNQLTRSLAAFALFNLVKTIDIETACSSVTDGTNDNGIDAIYFCHDTKQLFAIQAKWKKDGLGSIERGDCQKFITGLSDLLNARLDRFNNKLKNKESDLIEALNDPNCKFIAVLSYTGTHKLADDAERDFDLFLKNQNTPSDVIFLKVLSQKDLHSALAFGGTDKQNEVTFQIREWGQIIEPYYSVYGYVSGEDLAKIYRDYSSSIFEPNIRHFLGDTDVNHAMRFTIKNEGTNFWYLNNGVTILAENVKKSLLGGNQRDIGTFHCKNISVVNGAQTVGSLATTISEEGHEIKVPIKIISLEHAPEGFADKTTRSTNTQNRIENRDFLSLNKDQKRIQAELLVDGITYVIKNGQRLGDPSVSFDVEESTLAQVCAQSDISLVVLAKTRIGAFWENLERAPYKIIFNPTVNGPRLWALVRLFREIELQIEKKKLSLVEKRHVLTLVHGNRVITYEVFKRLDLSNLEQLENFTEQFKAIKLLTTNIGSILIELMNTTYSESFLTTFFKSPEKCRDLSIQVHFKLQTGTEISVISGQQILPGISG